MAKQVVFRRLATFVLTLYALGSLVSDARAVILYSSPTRNTSAPLAAQGLQGWDLQYQWGSYLATPIAPNYFVAAKHVGVASTLVQKGALSFNVDTTFNGVGYADDPGSDLRICRITGTFPAYAPLYNETYDGPLTGKTLTVFGRGTQRGAAYNNFASTLTGWTFGASDQVQSWGQNVVSGFYAYNGVSSTSLLKFNFDSTGIANEAAISTGDSSGGVFINSLGQWKLAGINYAVDSPWATSSGGTLTNADVFDARGLWSFDGATWSQTPLNGPLPVPGASYASNISDRSTWISSVVPEPSSAVLVMAAVAAVIAGFVLKRGCVCIADQMPRGSGFSRP